MHLKWNKELGVWQVTRISKEEEQVIKRQGLDLLMASLSMVHTENTLKEEIAVNEKQAKKSTKH
jgi:hypothetical protein